MEKKNPEYRGQATGGCVKSACGGSQAQLSHLPEEIHKKVHNHPCYSEEAHHYYARMHVAVAPACNIQCHYCNRKYDCSNESRPGVVSELLTPQQAVKKVLAVASRIPQMTVVGIAGPGDPLANPERTFATFREISKKAPDIKLCVSTNGLNLPEHVDELVKCNVDHVTITINCLDPDIGEKIYPWVFWKNRRVRGRKGAAILIRQQQKGLQMLVDKGILVKVNSVMIPGVNAHHLQEVSKVVKQKGAFLHNVMPLISESGHGTFYGVMGQRGPTARELRELQDACEGNMNMMRHCRQCRADAIGLLGEDRNAEFTMENIEAMDIDYDTAMTKRLEIQKSIEAGRKAGVKRSNGVSVSFASFQQNAAPRSVIMAVASSGKGVIDQHFGHAGKFLLYEVSDRGVRFAGYREVEQYCDGNETCGETEDRLQRTIRALHGCEVVLCSRIGIEPWTRLEEAGIRPDGEHAMEPVEEALIAVYQEMLKTGLPEKSVPAEQQALA